MRQLLPRVLSIAALSFALLSCTDSGMLSPMPEGSPWFSTAVTRPEIVISQVYGGGGNSGATYTHDFVELFNPGDQPVDVGGWRVSYTSAAGTSWSSGATLPAGVAIQPGRYYLVQMAQGTGGTIALPTPDATGNAAMSATAGKVVLARTATTPTVACPEGPDIVDLIAYGSTANCGIPTANLSNTTAALRNSNGCAYTGNSSADFSVGVPNPRNSASPASPCGGEQPEPPPPGEVATVAIAINDPREIPVGYTKPAFPTARDAYGTIISPPPAYTWTSSNPDVATVDQLGYIDGVSVGTVTITATAPNGVSGSNSITIIPGDAPTPAVYRHHVEFGIPTDGTPDDDYVMNKPQFVLSYSNARGGPNWVSWNINDTHFGPVDRCNCFTADQTLPAGFYKVVDFDYRNGGYDRGHMVQSFNRTTTMQENASTFLLTNILPQAANNNQGPWAGFESYVNDIARGRNGFAMKEVYVIAGGEYSAHPETLKGEGKVQIPEFTWKIVVLVEPGTGLAGVQSSSDLEVIAVRMPNDTIGARNIRNTPWQNFTTTVDAIEAATGYDFLDKLPDHIERYVENGMSYVFEGFFRPVENLPTPNRAKAGRAIPVKFSLGGDFGLNIFEANFPSSGTTTCDSSAPVQGGDVTVNAGGSRLTYDAATTQYTYVWKTERGWAGTCRQLVVKLNDGKEYRANFHFTK